MGEQCGNCEGKGFWWSQDATPERIHCQRCDGEGYIQPTVPSAIEDLERMLDDGYFISKQGDRYGAALESETFDSYGPDIWADSLLGLLTKFREENPLPIFPGNRTA